MTNDQFLNIIEKRLANGLSILNVGDDKYKERLTLALEIHRLVPHCPLVKLRYVYRLVHLKLVGGVPDKARTHAFIQFYELLEVAMGDHQWPDPKIPNNKHDDIRMKMQEANAFITSALNGEKLTDTQHYIVVNAATDEIKESIKAADVERKRKEIEAKREAVRQANEQRAADRKEAVKIKNGGHKPAAKKKMIVGVPPEIDLEPKPFCVSHKTRLMLNDRQKSYIDQCFGIARFTYNWCLKRWEELRAQGEKPFASEISMQFNEIAKEEFPFTYSVTHFAKATGQKAFEAAVNGFFNGKGFPKRKHRGLGLGSLNYVVGTRKQPILMDFNPDIPDSKPSAKRQYLLIPTFGYVKMAEKLRFKGQASSVTIRREADGHYYASFNVHISQKEWMRTHKITGFTYNRPTGIDLGVESLATLSNGIKIKSRPEDENLHQRKKELQMAISHQRDCHPDRTTKKQRNNQWSLAKINAKIRHQREDYINKVTTALSSFYSNVCIEDLNVNDMIQDGRAPGNIKDATFYRFRLLMEQKMTLIGHHLHIAEKFLPTTRTCSICGCIGEKIPLEVRTFHCKECGTTIDRDVNAAINLAKLIGLDEPNPNPADKGAITAVLQANGIMVHQAEGKSR